MSTEAVFRSSKTETGRRSGFATVSAGHVRDLCAQPEKIGKGKREVPNLLPIGVLVISRRVGRSSVLPGSALHVPLEQQVVARVPDRTGDAFRDRRRESCFGQECIPDPAGSSASSLTRASRGGTDREKRGGHRIQR